MPETRHSTKCYAGLKYETAQVAKAHDNVASNLEGMVVVPFTTWSDQHEVRITELKERLDELVGEWEALSNEARSRSLFILFTLL